MLFGALFDVFKTSYFSFIQNLNSYSTKNMEFVPIKLLERISNRSSKCIVFVESVKKCLCAKKGCNSSW